MATTSRRELPILGATPKSSISTLLAATGNKPLFRWNPDAKSLATSSGKTALINYSNRHHLFVDKSVGKLIAAVSGLSIPFVLHDELSEDLVTELIAYGFVIPADDFSDYEQMVKQSLAELLNSSHGLIIMPTEKCNFRCTYCYEDFERGRMSDAHAEALSRAIARIAGSVENFSLGFFGGEPLLCSDLVLRFSGEAFNLMTERGLFYSAGIATNGYLLQRDLFEQLLDVGVISYQITIDGSQEMHDRQRRTASGLSTFDRILSNIEDMAKVDALFSCIIRCNTNRQNYREVLSLFESDRMAMIRGDSRFLVDIHEIWSSEGTDVGPAKEEGGGCFASLGHTLDNYAASEQLETLGFATSLYSHFPGFLGTSCYAGKPNWFVVGPDLALYKCTVVFNREENKLGHVSEDGNLIFDELKNALWTGSNALTDASCGTCHYRIPCGGVACPLTRFTNGSKVCPDIKQVNNLQKWANAMAHLS